jgi:hypothetical protein
MTGPLEDSDVATLAQVRTFRPGPGENTGLLAMPNEPSPPARS